MSTPFLRLGEFAHSPAIEIFNPYVALQDWTGSPVAAGCATWDLGEASSGSFFVACF
jgi:hypothetical protein